jgi:hypothetical protein
MIFAASDLYSLKARDTEVAGFWGEILYNQKQYARKHEVFVYEEVSER